MDKLELEVATDLLMSVEGINSLHIKKKQVLFYYKGLDYSFNNLATIVQWYNTNLIESTK